jgi:PAS domain S-box-containing protein
MKDENMTKEQLIDELAAMRQRVVEIEINHKRAEEALRTSEEAARRLAKENEVIAEMGKIISSTLNVEEVYERFAEEVRKLIPFDRIMVALNNPEEGTATVAYVSGFGIEGRKVGDIYPLLHSGSGEVILTRAGFLVQPETVEELEGRFSTLISTFRSGLRSIMTVPLISGNQVIGALHFRSKKSKAYTDRDLRLAERIGDQIAGAIANAQLFTERKRAEEVLRESEERYRSILDNIEEGYFEVDLAGNFTFFNDSLCRELGYSQEEMMGMNNRQYMDKETAKKVYQAFNQVYATGEPYKACDWELKTKDGSKIIHESSISLMRNAQGERIGFRGVARNITEHKRIEEEREKLVGELQKALSEVKTLKGIFPICASCKKIRDDKGYWNQVEVYIRDRSEAEFSHGICPDCMKKLYGDILGEKGSSSE